MRDEKMIFPTNKKEVYENITLQLKGMFEDCTHVFPNLANAAALLNQEMENINWVGFYLLKSEPVLRNMYEVLNYGKCEKKAASNEILKVETRKVDPNRFEGILVLGPFQGKPACVEIKVGKGVCGTAVEEDSVIMVDDVHEFAGHNACDDASNSEIVLPIHVNDMVVAVLDIDSPLIGRFDEEDKDGLLEVVQIIEEMLLQSGNSLL